MVQMRDLIHFDLRIGLGGKEFVSETVHAQRKVELCRLVGIVA